ncbi:unnamed protein product, partial [Brassica napus]
QDLIEEILSRVPLTSQRAVLSTCKQWNGLYKDQSFTKKHLGKQANDDMVIMVCDSRVCLVGFDLQGFHKQKRGFVELSTKPIGQLNHITVSKVYHRDGLLFCIPKNSIPVVWNPYLGQVRWIKPSKIYSMFDSYCMGYDNKNNHKVLRLLYSCSTVPYEIYDFKSDSWRVLDVTPDWNIPYKGQGGLSLKGNTYFVAQRVKECRHFLDLNYRNGDSVILSSVREEQLAVLFYRVYTYETIEIRVTTKIEANELTWRTFLKVDVKPFGFSGMFWKFLQFGSFYVDEKKKVALICDNNFSRAYVIGDDNYFKVVAPGESTRWQHVCSYAPSSVQIQKAPVPAGGKRKVRDY